jgi:hypothetical protein
LGRIKNKHQDNMVALVMVGVNVYSLHDLLREIYS